MFTVIFHTNIYIKIPTYNKLPDKQLIDSLPDFCFGLHLQLVVLFPGCLSYFQFQLRLVSKP